MSGQSNGKSGGSAEPDPRSDPELADALRDLRAHVPPGQDPLFAAPSPGRKIKAQGESEHAVYVPPKTIPKGIRPVTPPEVKVVVVDPRKMTTGPRRIPGPNDMPPLEPVPIDSRSRRIVVLLVALLFGLVFVLFLLPRFFASRGSVADPPIETAWPSVPIASALPSPPPPPIASIEATAAPAPEATEAPEASASPLKARSASKAEATSQPTSTATAAPEKTSTPATPPSPSRNPTWF
jgi:hypothetical protein